MDLVISSNQATCESDDDHSISCTIELEPVESHPAALTIDALTQQDQPGTLTQAQSLEQRVSQPREILAVGCICLAMFTTQVGLGICVDLLHVIGEDFHIEDPSVLSWLIAGYSLTVGTFILFTGKVGDLYGWKRMFVLGFAWNALWSLVCGLAVYSNHVLFVFARVLQGIGPAMALPNGLALLGALYKPGRRKNMAFAVFGATAPVGSIFGSVIGGVFWLAWWPCKCRLFSSQGNDRC
jgi:MFS family permease